MKAKHTLLTFKRATGICLWCWNPARKGKVTCAPCAIAKGTRKFHIDWTEVDFSLSNRQIAEAHCVTEDVVRRRRKRATQVRKVRVEKRPAKIKQIGVIETRGRKPAAQWADVDWTRSNSAIAKDLGLSYQAVFRNRRKQVAR